MMTTLPIKYIVPDIEGKVRRLDKVVIVLFCTSFLIIPAFALIFINIKWGVYRRLALFIRTAKNQDKIVPAYFFGYLTNMREVMQALIDTGNLSGYHIVADVMMVKDGVEISEQEALAEYELKYNPYIAARMGAAPPPQVPLNLTNTAASACPYCGETINDAAPRFCPHCGKKI